MDDLEFTEKKMKTIKITDKSRGIPTANVLVCLLPVPSCLFVVMHSERPNPQTPAEEFFT